MDTRLADVVALMGLAFALPAALAAVPGDEADHQRYYNLHQRLVHGVRSGQVTADDAAWLAAKAAGGSGGIAGAGAQGVVAPAPDGMADPKSAGDVPGWQGGKRSDDT